MLETSSVVRPSKKAAQAELHVSVMVRFESRFEFESGELAGSRMIARPIIDKVACPFRRKLLDRRQAFGFDKSVQAMQVFEPGVDGMACVAIRF